MNKDKDIINKYDQRTYWDYLKLKDVNTKDFLMFAELIDNSISSFENNLNEDGSWKRKLIMDIKIDFNNDEEILFDQKVSSSSKILVNDNALGMSENILIEAIKLNRNAAKYAPIFSDKTSKMNVHGRGLKQCAFFFGMDLTVTTTDETGKTLKVEMKSSEQENVEAPIFIDPKETAEKKMMGTQVLIEKIYTDKQFSKSTLLNIITALQYRYIKYIEEDKIQISVKFNDENIINFCMPHNPKMSVSQVFEKDLFKETELEKMIVTVKKELDKKLMTLDGNKSHANKESAVEAFNIISNLLRKAKNDKKLIFDFNMIFKINEEDLPIKFWMLPAHSGELSGIRLFEGQRAIKHPGYKSVIETRPYMNWKKGQMETGSTENRFAGECDLSKLGLFSKTDKSSFTISEPVQLVFDGMILGVWMAYNQFVLRVRDEVRQHKTKPINSSIVSDFKSLFSSKFQNNNILFVGSEQDEKTKNITSVKLSYNSKAYTNWNIIIKINNDILPYDIFSVPKITDDDTNLEITVNQGHPFFNKMNAHKDFFSETLMPISILVAIQFIEFKESDGTVDPVDLIKSVGGLFAKNKNNKI